MTGTPLTALNARPGLRVRCVDASYTFPALYLGKLYTLDGRTEYRVSLAETPPGALYDRGRFVLAEPESSAPSVRDFLAANAPALLDALVRWRGFGELCDSGNREKYQAETVDLFEAIEAAGLLNKPQPVPLPAMFCGAEAFGEDGA